MELKGKHIGFALTGSFCTFKQVIGQIEEFVKAGANVIPIMSLNAANTDTRFGTAAEHMGMIEMYTCKSIITSITEAEPIGPAGILDLLIVAPATGNTIAKIANGIADTPVTLAVKAQLRNERPVLIAVSTNDGLGGNAKNIGLLMNTRNIYMVPFGQDDPLQKQKSLVAHMDKLMPAAELALEQKQIQPVLLN